MKFGIHLQEYKHRLIYKLIQANLQDIQVILRDKEFKKRKIRDNLYACSFIACLLCIIALTGLIGTYAPDAAGAVLPAINSTAVYLILFTVNVIFFVGFYQCLHGAVHGEKILESLVYIFLFINSSLACLTFFTTQDGSSFFFEYLLILILVYLLPIYDHLRVLCPIIAVNLVTTFVVIALTGHHIAWQDQYDIVLFYLVCLVIILSRRHLTLSFGQIRMNLRTSNEEFYQRSRTDELTGLLNREALREDFDRYLEKPICVMICDIDKFKFFNDTYGHGQGDVILSDVSRLLRHTFQGDCVYRYGGDEFLILSFRTQPEFQQVVEQFYQRLKALKFQNLERQPTMSGGYTWGICTGNVELRKMFALSDHLLYQAKEAGRDRVHYDVFDSRKAEASLHEIENMMDKSS